jgi:hypothetical protein
MSGAALLVGACLVVAPLDDVNEKTDTSTPDSAMGSGGDGGIGGTVGTGGGGSGGQDAAQCSTNQQCIEKNDNQPYRCMDGACVALRTEQCPVVLGRYDHQNAFFIGAFANFVPQQAGDDDVSWNYELAVNEFNSGQIGGLPGPNGKRMLAMVVCDAGAPNDDETTRRNKIAAGAEHLTAKLRVPAVIAALESGNLLETFDLYGAQKGVFFLTPGPATRAMLSVQGQNLLWNMLGLPADLAPTYAALLTKLEAYVKELRKPLPSVKVALVTTDEAADADLESAADDLLQFNGQNLQQNAANDLFREFTLQTSATPERVEQTAQAIVDFRPHIVISIAGPLFSMGRIGAFTQGGVLNQLEAKWASLGDRPYYILSPNNYPSIERATIPMIDRIVGDLPGLADMHKRFIGINVAGSEDVTLYNEYLKRLHDLERDATEGSENYYDAVYFLAYSIHAAGPKEQIFGSDIEFGISRLITGGREFKVGPDDILATFDELAKRDPEGRIRLNGTLGPPRFNGAYGVRVDTGAIYCLERQLATSTLKLHDQVGYFDRDAEQRQLQVSRRFAGKPLPCLEELNLPQPP